MFFSTKFYKNQSFNQINPIYIELVHYIDYVHGIVNSTDYVNEDRFDSWYADLKLSGDAS